MTGGDRRRDARIAAAVGALATLGGAVLVVVHHAGGADGDPEGWFAAIGFAAPFIGAGLLAVSGSIVDAPWQWWAAGFALVPMCVVSIVLFPLLVPAVALVVLGLRHRSTQVEAVCGGLLAVALVSSFGVVVFHQDPATWSGGSSSNIVTSAEAAMAVGVAAMVLVVGWAVARRSSSRPLRPAG